MSKVLFEKTDRIARITLNRPEVMNAIDDEVPHLLAQPVSGDVLPLPSGIVEQTLTELVPKMPSVCC